MTITLVSICVVFVCADIASEKQTRARLKSEVERRLSRDAFLILDSLNYIKGYRYELYNIARARNTNLCLVSLEHLHLMIL